MRFSRFVGATALSVMLVLPAQAECLLCDDIIELDDQLAQCYLKIYDSVHALFAEGHETVQINLGGCDGTEVDNQRGNMGILRTLPPTGPTRTVYKLDEERTVCLKSILEANSTPLSPLTKVDLYEACQ